MWSFALHQFKKNKMSTEAQLPVLGVLGVGTIGEAVARGLLSLPEISKCPFSSVIASPRGAAKSAALAASFPSRASVAASNQDVLDKAQWILVGLHHKMAEEVMGGLNFRPDHIIVSLMSCVEHETLERLTGLPSSSIFRATPLPAVAKQEGTTVVFPPDEGVESMFGLLGTCVSVPSADALLNMQVPTALMGDFYKRCEIVRAWLVASGVAPKTASVFLGSLFSTIVRDAKDRTSDEKEGENAFEELVAEQTPGGLNESVIKEMADQGGYDMLRKSLGTVHAKFAGK